jgi:ketosteroid isomerase-like protein
MSTEKNIQIIQQIYAAFGKGDVPGILEFISDEMTHFGVVAAVTKEVPWHLQITKKHDVPKFFQALASECEFTRFEPHAFAAAGDVVYCSIDFDVTIKRNGKKNEYRNAMHRFMLKNGRVVDWHGCEDTAQTRELLAAK